MTHTSNPIIDISVPISTELPVWPGDPAITIELACDVCCGDAATVRRLHLGSHTGTHVDAFSHFLPDGDSLSQMSLAPYVGEARVVDVGSVDVITQTVLEAHFSNGNGGHVPERLLFKTQNSGGPWFTQPFNTEFVHLSPCAAEWLVAHAVKLVGIDYLSVEGYHTTGAPVHHTLLGAGVYIVEGLYLAHVAPGTYQFTCLPMPVKDGDGAPARAILSR